MRVEFGSKVDKGRLLVQLCPGECFVYSVNQKQIYMKLDQSAHVDGMHYVGLTDGKLYKNRNEDIRVMPVHVTAYVEDEKDR